ncbi:MAG: helix-turn-helix domain-containing protein [Streptosporangiaceae bacterium]
MRVRSIADVAATVRGRRLDLGLTQAELARNAGISRKWISEFEASKATVEFALVMRVLEVLGLSLSLGEASEPALPRTSPLGVTESPPASSPVDLDVLLREYGSR